MSDKKRLVTVVTTWFPSELQPAQAPFNLNHAQAIALDSDVSVVHVRLGSSAPDISETYGGVRVHRRSLSPRHPLRALRLLVGIRRAARHSDVVHTMAFSSALVVAAAFPFSRRPWVHTEHWNGVTEPASVSRTWERLAWLRGVLRRPRHLTAVTSQLGEVLTTLSHGRPVDVVPCVVENPRPVSPRGSRGIHLVAVGYLVPRKNPLLAARVVAELSSTRDDVSMVWIGGGPQLAEVERELETLGITDRFTLTGMVDPDQVYSYFEEGNLFFLPTERENFFTAGAEALSAGLPVVVGRVGGFTDYMDESNAVITDDLTVEGYVRAILEAVGRFADVPADQLASPIRERFSRRRIADQFGAIYDDLTGS
jgi:glycosyltransferase involved in cell wall biosynthesis